MKRLIFFGVPSKSHLLLVLGKVLTASGQRVLLVDSTLGQGVQAYLPHGDKGPGAFVTEFEGMDVAAGFITSDQLNRHLSQQSGSVTHYDCFLIDTDHTEFIKGKALMDDDVVIWCDSLDKQALQRNRELMQRLCLAESVVKPLQFYRLILSFVKGAMDPRYFLHQYEKSPATWKQPMFQQEWNLHDAALQIESQHQERVTIRHLSSSYARLVQELALTAIEPKMVREAWRRLRKEERRGL